VLSFESQAYVRSGALIGETFYFGTGCRRGECDASAGKILALDAP
jgi:hypothetical protein